MQELTERIHIVGSCKPSCPVNSNNARPVDIRKPIPCVNSNKIVRTVNSDKPENSKMYVLLILENLCALLGAIQ